MLGTLDHAAGPDRLNADANLIRPGEVSLALEFGCFRRSWFADHTPAIL